MPALTKHTMMRVLSVGGFVTVFAVGFVYFWTGAGGQIPGITDRGKYEVSFLAGDVKNLRETGSASIAGVKVGTVKSETLEGEKTKVTLSLDGKFGPLHKGATVRVGVKSVVGQSYVDIVDGNGAELPDGSQLPVSAVKVPTDVDELLSTFDPTTRKDLSGAIQALDRATGGTSENTAKLMTGLGDLGREGFTAIDALSAQSRDLEQLVAETNTLMNALDTGQGQIADVVHDARVLTQATAGQSESIKETMRSMPALLSTARTATGKLSDLSGSLAPVAADLRTAAPDLSVALQQLPSVTADLRGLLPALNGTLDAAPATLSRIPRLGNDLDAFIPAARVTLKDVNPMLSYLRPYGRDIGAMLASFGASMDVVSENGIRPIRVAPIFNTRSYAGNPFPLSIDPLHWNNPYPAPGAAGEPKPFKGKYPRLERESK